MKESYITTIYRSIIEKKTNRQFAKALKRCSGINIKELFKYAYKNYKKYLDSDIPILPILLKDTNFSKIIKKFIGEYKLEFALKQIKENRYLPQPKIFYVSSYHKDCANDHKSAQGKIYVDKYYDSTDDELRLFVEHNKIEFIQDIIEAPTYMFTRPNCRHWFKAFDKSIIGCDISTILEKNSMVDKYEQYEGKEKIIRNAIQRYSNETRMLNKLNRIKQDDILVKKIRHNRILLRKLRKDLKDIIEYAIV